MKFSVTFLTYFGFVLSGWTMEQPSTASHVEARFRDQVSSVLAKAIDKNLFTSVSVHVEMESLPVSESSGLTYLPTLPTHQERISKIFIDLFLSEKISKDKIVEVKELIEKSFAHYNVEIKAHNIRGLDSPPVETAKATMSAAKSESFESEWIALLGWLVMACSVLIGVWWITRALKSLAVHLREFINVQVPERISLDVPAVRLDFSELKVPQIELTPLKLSAPTFEIKPLEVQAPALHLDVKVPKLQLDAEDLKVNVDVVSKDIRVEVAPVVVEPATISVQGLEHLNMKLQMDDKIVVDHSSFPKIEWPAPVHSPLSLVPGSVFSDRSIREGRSEGLWRQRGNLKRLQSFINEKPSLVYRCITRQNPEELNNFRVFVVAFDTETRRNFAKILGDFKQDILRPLPPVTMRENSEHWLSQFVEELGIEEMTSTEGFVDRLFPDEIALVKSVSEGALAETLKLFPDSRILRALMYIYTKEEFEHFVNSVDTTDLPMLSFSNPSDQEVVMAFRHFTTLLSKSVEFASLPQLEKDESFKKMWVNLFLAHLHELTLEEEHLRLEEAKRFDGSIFVYLENRYWSLHSLNHVGERALHNWLSGFSLHCLGTLLYFTSKVGLDNFKLKFERFLIKNQLTTAAMDWAETISQHADRRELLKYSAELRVFFEQLREASARTSGSAEKVA